MIRQIHPDEINVEHSMQARGGTSAETVVEYAEAMRRGEKFPPLLVYFDPNKDETYLADGFHRYMAHMQVRSDEPLAVERRTGTKEAAQWAAIGANQSHGLRRTNADKRRAVRLAVLHPQACDMSSRQIAEHVGVSDRFVSTIRSEMEGEGEIPTAKTPMDKAREALADPANEGRSNREIAEKIGVAKNTVDRARNGRNANGSNFVHHEESRTEPDKNQHGSLINEHSVGVERACDAINCLKRIPPNDPHLRSALVQVRDFCIHALKTKGL